MANEKFSDSGASILSGKGLAGVRERMTAAFEAAHTQFSAFPPPVTYIVEPAYHFERQSATLAQAALLSAYVAPVPDGPICIEPVKESAEELFKLCGC